MLATIATGRAHGLVTRTGHPVAARQRGLDADDVERRLADALSAGHAGGRQVRRSSRDSSPDRGRCSSTIAELLAIVDSWLASLTGEAFDGVVALLRRTFGAFEPAERRQIMTLLVTGRPVRSVTFGDGVDAERAAAALVTVRHLLGLPVDAGAPPADPVGLTR